MRPPSSPAASSSSSCSCCSSSRSSGIQTARAQAAAARACSWTMAAPAAGCSLPGATAGRLQPRRVGGVLSSSQVQELHHWLPQCLSCQACESQPLLPPPPLPPNPPGGARCQRLGPRRASRGGTCGSLWPPAGRPRPAHRVCGAGVQVCAGQQGCARSAALATAHPCRARPSMLSSLAGARLDPCPRLPPARRPQGAHLGCGGAPALPGGHCPAGAPAPRAAAAAGPAGAAWASTGPAQWPAAAPAAAAAAPAARVCAGQAAAQPRGDGCLAGGAAQPAARRAGSQQQRR